MNFLDETYLLTGRQIDALISTARRTANKSRMEADTHLLYILEAAKVTAPEPREPYFEIRFKEPQFEEEIGDANPLRVEAYTRTDFLINGVRTDAEDFVCQYNSQQRPPAHARIEYDPEQHLVYVTYANKYTGSFEDGATCVTVVP